ncbi:B2 bradykinin receptor-like [Anabas testudineus]|uniref:B2 bradykinin receptor-like n=1 Tax=Anabas testudineus TaxID=64144 RepID=UPI000E45FA8F|nr:B2 bradykinin receptor-like [Anabas testudineus]
MAFPSTSVPANFSLTAIQSGGNKTECAQGKIEDWAFSVLQVYILLISVTGILFNVFVLMVFCFHKKPCTVAEVYLSNLAAADLVLVSFLPFWAISASQHFNWPFGSVLCRLVNLAIIMNMYCSIYFLVLISADRYLALVHPLSHEVIRRPKYAKVGCLLVWGLGLLLSVPTLIYREVEYKPDLNITTCYLNYPNTNAILLLEVMLTTFSFIIPIFFISFCTWKIIQALSNRVIVGLTTQKMEQKATTLILAVLLAFLICWVPFHLVRTMELLFRAKVLVDCKVSAITFICKQIFMYFAFFNSVLNPILYVIVGKNFRKKVRELFDSSIGKQSTTFSLNSTRTYLKSVRTSVRSANVLS